MVGQHLPKSWLNVPNSIKIWWCSTDVLIWYNFHGFLCMYYFELFVSKHFFSDLFSSFLYILIISYISFLCFTHFFRGLSAEAGGKSELGVCRNGDSRFAQENRRLQHEISALDGKVLHVIFCGRFCASTIRSKWVDEWIVDDLWSEVATPSQYFNMFFC